MSVKFVIAVTDKDWYDSVRKRSQLGEVNFWSPSTHNSFKALQTGELFLFKLHAPYNCIAGGGIFVHASEMPLSFAWEAFGEANGAQSLAELSARVAKYRNEKNPAQNFNIGCRILVQPFFFEQADWIAAPPSWKKNIVSYKTYNTDKVEDRQLWEQVRSVWNKSCVDSSEEKFMPLAKPQLIVPRLGQGAFRVLVTDIYQRRCAITHERTLPTLEAAHIKPYSKGGLHEAGNGLLFRSDIHRLFDSGYVTVSEDYKFEVSRKIKEEFENGRDYYAMHGKQIRMPQNHKQSPSLDALRWHNQHCYLG